MDISYETHKENLVYSGARKEFKKDSKGKGTGEKRINIKSELSLGFFYNDFEPPEYVFYTKKDLLHYLEMSQLEFLFPTQNYREKEKLTDIFITEYNKIQALDDDVVLFKMCAHLDYKNRMYFTCFSARDSKKYNTLCNIMLPQYTDIKFYRIYNRITNKLYIYMRPDFTKEYSIEDIAKVIRPKIEKKSDKEEIKGIIRISVTEWGGKIKKEEVDKLTDELVHKKLKKEDVKKCIEDGLRNYNTLAKTFVCGDPEARLSNKKLYDMINDVEINLSTECPNIIPLLQEEKKEDEGPETTQKPKEGEGEKDAEVEAKEGKKESTEPEEAITDKTKQPATTNFSYEQIIFFGAPGVGKSYKINDKQNIFRTTFHPDSDYSSFVGSYKPVADINNKITYEFRPQVFLDALTSAWLNPYQQVNLVIEEINRGNCAQIFGDLFQLLDRNEHGYSTYPIKVDDDIWNYLMQLHMPKNFEDWMSKYYGNQRKKAEEAKKEALEKEKQEAEAKKQDLQTKIDEKNTEIENLGVEKETAEENGKSLEDKQKELALLEKEQKRVNRKIISIQEKIDAITKRSSSEKDDNSTDHCIAIPANMNIYATMNTSDQSLFPMDSAFKRRWDWEYVPIDPENEKSDFTITIQDENGNPVQYRWLEFMNKINRRIYKLTGSEDKQLGNFFIKKDLDSEEFISKVMFYLWSEVCKDEENTPGYFFKTIDDPHKTDGTQKIETITFQDLYPIDSDEADKNLHGFMEYIINDVELKEKH